MTGLPPGIPRDPSKPSGNFNAAKCAEYLRFVGVEITEAMEAGWRDQERTDRARIRAHNREIKRSCGHFRTHPCLVTSPEGRFLQTVCSDCGLVVQSLKDPSGGGGGGLPMEEVA